MTITHLLTVVVLSSAVVATGCLGGGYTLANIKDNGSTVLITRELPWDGATTLSVDVPAIVRYVQAPGEGKIVARGPDRVVSTLTVSNGHVHDLLVHTGAVLEITVTAPSVKHFYLNGRSRLSIESYAQDALVIFVQGSATVDAAGSTNNATVFMQGASTINLARLRADAVTGTVTGFGTLIAGPLRTANLDVQNFASAVLLTRPVDLKTKLEHAGRVIDATLVADR